MSLALQTALGGPEAYDAASRAVVRQMERELRAICPEADDDLILARSREIVARLIGAAATAASRQALAAL